MNYIKLVLFSFFLCPICVLSQNGNLVEQLNRDRIDSLIKFARYDEAMRLCFSDLNQVDRSDENGKDTLLAYVYNSISRIFVKRSLPDSSIYYAQRVLETLKGTPYEKHYEKAKAYDRMAACYYLLGENSRAIEHYKKSLALYLARFGENHLLIADAYQNIGSNYNIKRDYNKAIRYFHKAESIYSTLRKPDHLDFAATYNGLGVSYSSMGEVDRGIRFFERALQVYRLNLGTEHPNVAIILNSLGISYGKKKDYSAAIGYFEKGISIFQNVFSDEHVSLVQYYSNLGSVYMNQGDYTKADEYYKKSLVLKLANFGHNNPHSARSYFDLGALQEAQKNYPKAIEYFKTVRQIYADFFDAHHPDLVEVNIRLARIYIKMEDLEKAKALLNRSEQLFHYKGNELPDFEAVADLKLLGKLYALRQFYFKALYRKSGNRAYLDTLQQAYDHMIAMLEYRQKELPEHSSRQENIDAFYWVFEAAIANLLERQNGGDFEKAFEIAEKSKSRRLMEGFVSTRSKAVSGVPETLLEKEHQLNIDITLYHSKRYHRQFETQRPDDSLVDQYKSETFRLRREQEALIQTIKNEYPDYYRLRYETEVATVAAVRDLLGPNEALLEYFVGDSSIYIFLLLPGELKTLNIKKDFPLGEWVTQLRENIYSYWMLPGQTDQMYSDNNALYVEAAHRLYEKLLAPLSDYLPERLMIVPDGPLHLVPFEALLIEKPVDASDFTHHRFLLKDHLISYNKSSTTFHYLTHRKQKRARGKLLAFAPSFEEELVANRGLVSLREGLGKLHFNVDEVEAIRSILGEGDLYVGKGATKTRFMQLADGYNIIHLSTHGKSNDKMGDFSFVAFAELKDTATNDERLYVSELYNMKLKADMVVLSACETGLGELKTGEGLIDLSHGFTYAGANSMVTSLWKVNDRLTTLLMEHFYRNLKKGMAKDMALRSAKLTIMEEEAYAAPFYWSSFIVGGNRLPVSDSGRWPKQWILILGGLVLVVTWFFLRKVRW